MIARGIFTVSFVVLTMADAAAYCSKPDAPFCATRYGSFDDHDDFDRCKREVEHYQSEVEDFLSCLKRESSEAISDYNDAVESFNRRARS